jgi:hypothetical protein
MKPFHYNQDTVADAAASILEASSDELASLTKVMLSAGASYGEINAVRDKLGSDPSSVFLLKIVNVIARDTSLFNSFVQAYKLQK